MEIQKLDIFDWFSKKRRYQFSEKNILDVFINELSYLHIEDQYKIFINKLNLIEENSDNFKMITLLWVIPYYIVDNKLTKKFQNKCHA